MLKRTVLARSLLIVFSAAAAVASSAAFGQQANQAPVTLERVEITGSSIRRIDAESALPVQVLKRQDIERSGVTSTVDLLRRVTAVQGSTGESAATGATTFGFSGVSVHNLNEQRTLVLLNGHRLASFGGQTFTGAGAGVDLNSIPISAIERVEVLTDGASALYGSDAIAGVVNFITRHDISTGDVTVGFSRPKDGGREKRVSATKGFGSLQEDGYNVLLSFGHDDRTLLQSTDRSFGKTGQVFFSANGKNYRVQQHSAFPAPANATDDSGFLISPYQKVNGACPPKSFFVDDGVGDQYCGFDFIGEIQIYPERKRDSFFGSVDTKVGDQNLFLNLLASRTTQTARIAPVPGLLSIPAGSDLANKYLLPVGIAGDSIALYRVYDLGKRIDDDEAKFYDLALGSRGSLMGWDYNATYTHSQSNVKGNIAGYPGALALNRLTDGGLLDPFVLPGQQSAAAQAALNAANYRGYWDGGVSNLDTLSVRGSRELVALPAGSLSLGLGVNLNRERIQSKPSLFAQGLLADPVAGTLCDLNDPAKPCDQRFDASSTTVPYSGDRKSYGAFAELVIPALKTLELGVGVRYDHLSDAGQAVTGKGSFRWTPMPNLLIRGSLGTGFHAPTVPQLTASRQPFGVTSGDYLCTPDLQSIAASLGAECRPGSGQYDVVGAGNKNQVPEKSRQATLGIRFEPVTTLSIGADLWHVEIRDAFGQFPEQLVFGNPLQFPGSWTSNRDIGTGKTYLAFLATNQNLGKQFSTGIDFDISARARTSIGALNSQFTLTYMIREDQQLLRDGPYFSAIGQNSDDLGAVTFRWQGRWVTTLTTGNWTNTLGMNFKSGYTDATTTVDVLDATGTATGQEDIRLKVPTYFTFDWQTQWSFRKDMTLTMGALNLFDRVPPLSISAGGLNRGQPFGYDDRYYDPRGRTLYANFTYKF